jgi:pSer/pThr/pTyr-binding forkhead associated (FHA) protein
MSRPLLALVPDPEPCTDATPAEPEARLGVRVVAGMDHGRTAIFVDGLLRVGGHWDNHLPLTDPLVDPHHAELRETDLYGVVVRDLGSCSGTWWGGRRFLELRLEIGERFQVGVTDVELVLLPPEPEP